MIRRLIVRRSPIHGNGVYAAVGIPARTALMQYKGRPLTDKYIVDANVGGNSARWINHSCSPNCEAWIEEVDGGLHDKVMIGTKRAIKAGEELTYDYGITLDVPHTAKMKRIWACHCGAKRCTGT